MVLRNLPLAHQLDEGLSRADQANARVIENLK